MGNLEPTVDSPEKSCRECSTHARRLQPEVVLDQHSTCRKVFITEKYKDEPQEDPATADPKDGPATDDPKDDPATDKSEPISIENAKVALTKTAFTYNGKVQKPAIDTIGGKQLTEGADYRAVWTDESSKKPGTYMVVIVGTGDYTGIAKAT